MLLKPLLQTSLVKNVSAANLFGDFRLLEAHYAAVLVLFELLSLDVRELLHSFYNFPCLDEVFGCLPNPLEVLEYDINVEERNVAFAEEEETKHDGDDELEDLEEVCQDAYYRRLVVPQLPLYVLFIKVQDVDDEPFDLLNEDVDILEQEYCISVEFLVEVRTQLLLPSTEFPVQIEVPDVDADQDHLNNENLGMH